MTTHLEARHHAESSLQLVFGEPTSTSRDEGRHLTGVGCLETSYGQGWKGAGRGSNNMGAIQAGSSWTGDTFEYTDTHPNDDGTSTPYRIAFRKYATPAEGWADLCRVMYVYLGRRVVRERAQQNDTYGVSRTLHETHYYEGFGKTVAERIRNHYRALSRSIGAADTYVTNHRHTPADAEPLVTIPPTIRRWAGYRGGSEREAVKQLQRELRLAADGLFGPITEQTVRDYQAAHTDAQGAELAVDGIVGPKTWTALLTDDYVPEAV